MVLEKCYTTEEIPLMEIENGIEIEAVVSQYSLLHHFDTEFLALLTERCTNVLGVGRQQTFGQLSLQNHHDGNTAGDADRLGHGTVACGVSILAQGAGTSLLSTVLVLDAKTMLQEDEVAFVGFILHLGLQRGTKGIQWGPSRSDGVIPKESHPPQTSHDALLLVCVLEFGLARNGPHQVSLSRRRRAQHTGGGVLPCERLIALLQEIVLILGQESHVDERLDVFTEASIPERAADDGMRFRDGILFLERGGIAIWIGDKIVAGVAGLVGLVGRHEIFALDFLSATVLQEFGRVAQSEEDAARGPGEFVAQGIVTSLRSWQTAAIAQKGRDFAALSMNFIDSFDGIQVVNAGIETNLIHDGDAGLLDTGLELLHGGTNVRCRHDIGLVPDGGLNDQSMEGVGDETDCNVDLCHFGIESGGIGHVE